jgi:hypothetical protein
MYIYILCVCVCVCVYVCVYIYICAWLIIGLSACVHEYVKKHVQALQH